MKKNLKTKASGAVGQAANNPVVNTKHLTDENRISERIIKLKRERFLTAKEIQRKNNFGVTALNAKRNEIERELTELDPNWLMGNQMKVVVKKVKVVASKDRTWDKMENTLLKPEDELSEFDRTTKSLTPDKVTTALNRVIAVPDELIVAPAVTIYNEPTEAAPIPLSITEVSASQPTTQVSRKTNLKVYPKHRLNIFPRMNEEDFARLISDIKTNGFDPTQPIYLYENAILDGWNRDQACQELGITPKYEDFLGNDLDALKFVMRTNKRRNITSSQWAAIAVESTDLIAQIQQSVEKERREKQKITKKMSDEERMSVNNLTNMNNAKRTTSVIAELVGGTNRQYVHDISGIKAQDAELFTQVKDGEISVGEAKKRLKNKVVGGSTPQIVSQSPYRISATKRYQIFYILPSFNQIDLNNEDSKTLRDLHDLNVPEIAEDNAVMFLHIPPQFEQQAMKLVKSWGFKYVESIIALHIQNPYPAEYSDQVLDTIDEIFDIRLSRVGIFTEQRNGWDCYNLDPKAKKMMLMEQTGVDNV
jgi:hypothetical protein